MNTLTINDFRKFWLPGQDKVRGEKGLTRSDNLCLDEYGAVTVARGRRLVNPDQFLGGVHTIYSRQLAGTRYRYVGLTDGSTIRDDGAGDFNTVINLAGNGSTRRAAFGSGFNFVYIVSGNRKTKDLGASHVNLGVQAPPNPIGTESASTPEKTIPDSYAVTAAEGSNVSSGATYFTADSDSSTFRLDAYRTFASTVDTMDFGSDNFGTDNDRYIFSVRIPDLQKLLRIQLVFYFNTVDGSPDTSPDQTDYYAFEFLNTDAQFIRDGSNQWSTLGARRVQFERVGSDATKNWTNVKGFRVIASFSEAVTGIGFSSLRVIGGSKGPLTGKYEYRQINVNNTGTYLAKSPSSPAQDHSTEVYHSAITVTPNIDATDTQINEVWIFRRKVDTPGSDPLARFLRVKVIDTYPDNTPFDDIVTDEEVQEINIELNLNLFSPQDDAFPDDVYYLEVNYFGRTIYMSPREILISDYLDPDLIDSRFTLRVSGDSFESNLWMTKVGSSTLLVGTTNDIYEISGDGTELPDGSINFTLRPLGIKQPPTQDVFSVYHNSLYYINAEGVGLLNGTSNVNANGWMDLLFNGYDRFGIKAIDMDITDTSKCAIAAIHNKVYFTFTLTQDEEDSPPAPKILVIYDIRKDYWTMQTHGPSALFAEETGKLLAGYSDTGDYSLRQLDTLTGIDSESTGLDIVFRTSQLDDNLPFNRKDSYTLKLKIDTGGRDCSVNIYPDGSDTPILVSNVVNANGVTELAYDISGNVGIVKAYQIEITGNVLTFKLEEMALEYDARPKQTLFLRIPPNNYGIAGRKRFPTVPMVLDTLGHDVTFTPIIDGLAQATSTFNSSDKQVVSHLFTSAKDGYTIGGTLQGSDYFEFYELVVPRPLAIEQLPDPQKYGYVPNTNLGTQSRKRFIAFAFVIDTKGGTVSFTPVIDNVSGTPSSFTTNGKLTYIHYFTSDTVGTDIGGILSGTAAWEFYGVNLEECISEKMPAPAKFLLIPEDDYGTPARKRFSSYKFRINTKGQNVTFTPRVDGVNKTSSTVNTTEPTVHEHFFVDEDVIGINIGGTLSGSTEFEFYGPLRPRVVEELPDRLKYFVVPENNFGIAAKKRVRTIPLVINTNGQDVTFTPIVDGVADTPSTFNTSSKRTVLHYFTDDSFGIDYKGIIAVAGSQPFEFYGMLKPEDVQELPVGKKFDQLGPIEFPKIGKVLGFRIRIIPEGTSISYTMYAQDVQIGSPGTINCDANKDQVLEVKLPKGINATVFRVELSSSNPFHRYYARFHVNKSGMDSEAQWILFGADPDAKLK